ncbi:class I SAM-dependent methyltransferase [Kangiella sp. M94]
MKTKITVLSLAVLTTLGITACSDQKEAAESKQEASQLVAVENDSNAEQETKAEKKATTGSSLLAIIEGEHRSEANKARNQYRNPAETLKFFGIKPGMTVVEVSPGGGWYTEVLAPWLGAEGKLYAAHFDPDTEVEYYQNSLNGFKEKIAANPDIYSNVELTVFDATSSTPIAPANSADVVVTFRNVHNWMRGGRDDALNAFKLMHDAVKPGGYLGVVEHRLATGLKQDEQASSGYMHEKFVIDLAEEAGFKLLERSQINANPKDTTDHPKGVWTLPPSLRLGDENRETYLEIGESDRMTLKFVKPATE